MQRLPRALTSAKSVHGRIAAIAATSRLPLARSIVRGTEETRQTKLLVKQKVAWAHARPLYLTYTELLTQALATRSIDRLHTVLKRMLDDDVRHGKPTGVTTALLDQCAHLIVKQLPGAKRQRKEICDAVSALDEITWRTRHPTDNTLWNLLRFLAHRAGARVDKYALALQQLRFVEADIDLLLGVIQSPRPIGRKLLVDLSERSVELVQSNLLVATEFYIAAMREEEPTIPYSIRESLARFHVQISQMNGQSVSGTGEWKSVLALAHNYTALQQRNKAKNLIDRLSQMSTSAEWPLSALPTIIDELSAAGQRPDALELLRSIATRNYAHYVSLAGGLPVFQKPDIMVSLLADELRIRLQAHKHSSETKRLPATAFFVPNIRYNMDIPRIQTVIDKYYERLGQLISLGDVPDIELVKTVVLEAGVLAFRMQSAEPVKLVVCKLADISARFNSQDALALLTTLTMALRNISAMRYTEQKTIPEDKHQYSTLTRLASPISSHGSVQYIDPLHSFSATRQALLAAYLRLGVEPPVEAQAMLYLHMAGTNDKRASKLAARIFGDIPPSLTSKHRKNHLVMQAFYEQQLLKAARSSRWLIRMFHHIMGHANVDSVEFQQRIVNQAVVQFIRHRHFKDLGFFALEKSFIRFVDQPRFAPDYLNVVRPRFWALHMFLRKHNYVAKMMLHKRMFRVHKYKLFVLQATSIPCASKMKAQGVSNEVVDASEQGIAEAIGVFMSATPPDLLGTERYSVERMIEEQTQVVKVNPGKK